MKLSPDCVRDILVTIENCEFGEYLNLDKLQERLPNYSEEELWYTTLKLEEAGYIQANLISIVHSTMPAIKSIDDLTFVGHEFLNSVRSDTVWSKVKEIAKKIGVFSIKSLAEIAKGVVAEAISGALQPHP